MTADNDTGALTGMKTVIDKDLTAALLAEDLKANRDRCPRRGARDRARQVGHARPA